MADPIEPDRPVSLRERIVSRALELYNERGIEYVGVRELARELGVQAGNVTYHFPTKDDLVLVLADQLREAHADSIRIPRNPTLHDFLDLHRRTFQIHQRFRCIYLSLPRLLENERLAETLREAVWHGHERWVPDYLERLRKAGALLRTLGHRDIERLSAFLALAHHGWLADAAISLTGADPELSRNHYLRILADHLRGVATITGRAELQRFQRGLE